MNKRLTIPNRVPHAEVKFKKGGVTMYVFVERLPLGDRLGQVCRIHIQSKGAKGSDLDALLDDVTAHINTQLKIIEVTP